MATAKENQEPVDPKTLEILQKLYAKGRVAYKLVDIWADRPKLNWAYWR